MLYANCTEVENFQKCHNKIKTWSANNFLKLNNNKTQLICLSPRSSIVHKPGFINLMGEEIKTSSTAKYLGIWLDENLIMSRQVSHVCSQGFWAIKNLWKISAKLNNFELRKQLVHSCVLSKINFCSALYHTLSKKEQKRLDRLIKAAARFIYNIYGYRRWQPMTPFLQKLHFLPIAYRTEFKINLLTYKCLNSQGPNYLSSLLLPRVNHSTVATRKDLDYTWLNSHPFEKINYRSKGFRFIAPVAWNRLDKNIRESPNIDVFKTRLKTFYYNHWLNA